MGTLRPPPPDPRQRSKVDEDDLIYKVRGLCTWRQLIFFGALLFLAISLVLNILYSTGTLPLGSESSSSCGDGLGSGDPYNRQSGSNGTLQSAQHPTGPNHRAVPTPAGLIFSYFCRTYNYVEHAFFNPLFFRSPIHSP